MSWPADAMADGPPVDRPPVPGLSPRGAWHSANGRLLARAFCYILEECDPHGTARWRGVCHLHPVTARTRIPFGPGRFVLALDEGARLELDARVTIEGDSGSIRATFKDVAPPTTGEVLTTENL